MLHFCSIVILAGILYANGNFLEVTIPDGILRGIVRKTWTGKEFLAFVGIPYAKPPIGNLRFEPPAPSDPWNGILEAVNYRSKCTQDNLLMNITLVTGNEDCLYLNVYTPKIRSTNATNLPVMFYIHGGGWMFGSGSDTWHGPDFLLNEDIVLVTHNYRLGALGFISMVDDVIPGNNGLKDQSLALQWTKRNIEYFGGDSNRITVFGNSAGASSSHFQLLSSKTKDLISGAILQSGSAFAPWALSSKKRARTNTRNLAKQFGCPISNSKEILQCLKKVNASDIITLSARLYKWSVEPVIPFRPVIEPVSENAFLSESPEDLVKIGEVAQVPIITTITTGEGIMKASYMFNENRLLRELSENFYEHAPSLVLYDEFNDQRSVTNEIKDFYLHNQELSEIPRIEIVNLLSDPWFIYPSQVNLEMHTKYVNSRSYQLVYDYRSSRSFGDLFGSPQHNYGVCHCDELLNLFSTKMFGVYHQNRLDEKAVQTLTRLWTNFARTGNPTPNEEFPKWEAAVDKVYFINNNMDFKTTSHPFKDRLKFWSRMSMQYKKVKYLPKQNTEL